eukprot:1041472-Pyramimonas_sp.AAC.1
MDQSEQVADLHRGERVHAGLHEGRARIDALADHARNRLQHLSKRAAARGAPPRGPITSPGRGIYPRTDQSGRAPRPRPASVLPIHLWSVSQPPAPA